MASGVCVSDQCKTVFQEIKRDKKHRYIVFHIMKGDSEIAIEHIGARNATYDDFVNHMTEAGQDVCRYGLFDFEYPYSVQGASESTMKEKMFLMSWCPDTAKIKQKMLYSSSFDALKKSLVGVPKFIQATDMSEMSKEEVEKQLRQTDRS